MSTQERTAARDRYDFPALARSSPELAAFVRRSPRGTDTIDFADPAAVRALNRALLRHDYGVAHWDIPPGYLCPPIPSRADYLHALAALLGGRAQLRSDVVVLDIGVGANCIYPLLGASAYGWRFVGTEVDAAALAVARRIVGANPALSPLIDLRQQHARSAIFRGVIRAGEQFAASICNPPFHASAAEAAAGTARKLRNLGGRAADRPARNFGGQSHELWCPGGEARFLRQMIAESATAPHLCRWFTSLVSKRENLPPLLRALEHVHATAVRTIPLRHGQKQTRILAWTFNPNPA